MITEIDANTSLTSKDHCKNSSDSEASEIPNAENLSAVVSELHALRLQVTDLSKILEEITAIQSPLADVDKVADYFGRSPDTIRRWVKNRTISCYKVPHNKGYTLLFSWRQLEEDLESYNQPAI